MAATARDRRSDDGRGADQLLSSALQQPQIRFAAQRSGS
jgi:hypothetical protein